MLQKSNTWRVCSVFFKNPNKKYELMEISREIKLAHTSVKRILKELENENLIMKKNIRKGKRTFPLYSAQKNEEFKRSKIIFNTQNIMSSGLMDSLIKEFQPGAIVIFGSYQKGEDKEDSDIDIYIDTNEKKINLNKYEQILSRKIQLHMKHPFSSYPDELKNSIVNGRVIYGYLEVFQ